MRLYMIREIFVAQVKIITRHRFGTFGAVVLLFFALVGLLVTYLKYPGWYEYGIF